MKISVGDTVQLKASFLRSTGQITGPEPFKRWIVLGVQGNLATVDEPRFSIEDFTRDELAADPSLRFRRVAVGNLKLVSRHEVEL